MRDIRIGVNKHFPLDKVKQCDGIPGGMLVDLIADDRCTSRVIAHRDGRGVVEYWVIPVDLADKWGMSYINNIQDAILGSEGVWAKHTGANEISMVTQVTFKKTGAKVIKGKWGWYGPLSLGYQTEGYNPVYGYLLPNTPAVKRSSKATVALFNKRQVDAVPDPRDVVMIDHYLRTDEIANAVKVGHPHMGRATVSACSMFFMNRVKKKRARIYLEKTLEEHARKALENAGVADGQHPVEWLLQQRIEIIQKATSKKDGSLLHVAEKAVNKLEEALTSKVTGSLSGGLPGPPQIPILSPERKAQLDAERKPTLTITKTSKEVKANEDAIPVMQEVREDEFPSSDND